MTATRRSARTLLSRIMAFRKMILLVICKRAFDLDVPFGLVPSVCSFEFVFAILVDQWHFTKRMFAKPQP